MASVYQRSYRTDAGEKARCAAYTVETTIGGRVCRLGAFLDKRASEEYGRKVERLESLRAAGERPDPALSRWLAALPAKQRNALEKLGLLSAQTANGARPLTEHVSDFRQHLLDRGGTLKHAKLTDQRIRAVLDGTGTTHLSQLTTAAVARYLADRRTTMPDGRPGLGAASYNHHVRAIKSFAAWLVSEGRAHESPLLALRGVNAETDRRRKRRALDPEELVRLLATTETGPKRYGMTGPERAMLYRVALETGFRAGELRSLTRGSFHLGDEPSVTVAAGYSKRRRADVLPLRAELAAALDEHLAGKLPGAGAFPMPIESDVAEMLRADLADARAEWIGECAAPERRMERNATTFLAYADEAGCVADFHSLRHTFITNLVRGGVHPREAQALARHSTITLTMDRYSHVSRRDLRRALAALPSTADMDASHSPSGETGGQTGGDSTHSNATSQREFAQTACDAQPAQAS